MRFISRVFSERTKGSGARSHTRLPRQTRFSSKIDFSYMIRIERTFNNLFFFFFFFFFG